MTKMPSMKATSRLPVAIVVLSFGAEFIPLWPTHPHTCCVGAQGRGGRWGFLAQQDVRVAAIGAINKPNLATARQILKIYAGTPSPQQVILTDGRLLIGSDKQIVAVDPEQSHYGND